MGGVASGDRFDSGEKRSRESLRFRRVKQDGDRWDSRTEGKKVPEMNLGFWGGEKNRGGGIRWDSGVRSRPAQGVL